MEKQIEYLKQLKKKIELKDQEIESLKDQAADFLKENIKDIKKSLPKKNGIYKTKNGWIRSGRWSNETIECKYVRVIDNRIAQKRTANNWDLIPTINVRMLDENMNLIKEGWRSEERCQINLIGEEVKIYRNAATTKNLYVIRVENTNLYKIGVTNNLKSRLSQLKTSNPFPLTVTKYFKDCDGLYYEKQLHELFKNKRKEGEWFLLDRSDLEQIDNFIETH